MITALALVGCDLRDVEEAEPDSRIPEVPPNLAEAIPVPNHNPLTPEGIALGRMLFYDPGLSANGQVSCASCHQQDKAFSDGQALSKAGVSGKPLLRHAPTLVNLAWMDGMFWDGGAKNLEAVSMGPLTHADEMGQNLNSLLLYLRQHRHYPAQFEKAFDTDSITSPLVLRALAQFQRTLISANSRYDRYVRKEPGGKLSSLELQGMALFRRHCDSCHATDFFTDNRYHNNGLDSDFPEDHEQLAYGRGRITGIAQDIGRYKTPSLRNIALTAPYMHDGRFGTLQEVLQHYSSGIKSYATLAPQLQQNGSTGIALSLQEQQQLIAFLHTLTDSTFISNNAYGNPWELQ
ncbi:cytochrome-c peroxidase [Pontibacter sp. HSC-14F20]|uniref:cytochrome-c peroxidase n=1 Tax=Pontibacter sp. HSC-14F20 TaxID=2864136 RepID=UPI001C738F3C|nr:cytochrome c peroxidase [Pontibacter sp. HSC-14F20]MBX0333108.1 cytochrome-c peroxidase [Pontibacter sp. HSC-14F20]